MHCFRFRGDVLHGDSLLGDYLRGDALLGDYLRGYGNRALLLVLQTKTIVLFT